MVDPIRATTFQAVEALSSLNTEQNKDLLSTAQMSSSLAEAATEVTDIFEASSTKALDEFGDSAKAASTVGIVVAVAGAIGGGIGAVLSTKELGAFEEGSMIDSMLKKFEDVKGDQILDLLDKGGQAGGKFQGLITDIKLLGPKSQAQMSETAASSINEEQQETIKGGIEQDLRYEQQNAQLTARIINAETRSNRI